MPTDICDDGGVCPVEAYDGDITDLNDDALDTIHSDSAATDNGEDNDSQIFYFVSTHTHPCHIV